MWRGNCDRELNRIDVSVASKVSIFDLGIEKVSNNEQNSLKVCRKLENSELEQGKASKFVNQRILNY